MARTDTTHRPQNERLAVARRPLPRSATDPDHLTAIGVMTPEEARKYKAYLDAVERFEGRFGPGAAGVWTAARRMMSELESLRSQIEDRERHLRAMMVDLPTAVRDRVEFYGTLRGELCLITGEASNQVREFDECLERMRTALEGLGHSWTEGGSADAVSPTLDRLDAADRGIQEVLRGVRAQLSND